MKGTGRNSPTNPDDALTYGEERELSGFGVSCLAR